MQRRIVLLLIMLGGFLVLAAPDSDVRLFSISDSHGPSIQDAVGLILILIPYTYLCVEAWKKRARLGDFLNSKIFKFSLFFFGLGLGLVIASVGNDYAFWWIYGVVILVVLQIPVFYSTLK
jgi:hypothetical protein